MVPQNDDYEETSFQINTNDLTNQKKLDDLLKQCHTVTETFNLIWENWREFPKNDPADTFRSNIKSMPIPTAFLALR